MNKHEIILHTDSCGWVVEEHEVRRRLTSVPHHQQNYQHQHREGQVVYRMSEFYVLLTRLAFIVPVVIGFSLLAAGVPFPLALLAGLLPSAAALVTLAHFRSVRS
jgi:hypothetical protein